MELLTIKTNAFSKHRYVPMFQHSGLELNHLGTREEIKLYALGRIKSTIMFIDHADINDHFFLHKPFETDVIWSISGDKSFEKDVIRLILRDKPF